MATLAEHITSMGFKYHIGRQYSVLQRQQTKTVTTDNHDESIKYFQIRFNIVPRQNRTCVQLCIIAILTIAIDYILDLWIMHDIMRAILTSERAGLT